MRFLAPFSYHLYLQYWWFSWILNIPTCLVGHFHCGCQTEEDGLWTKSRLKSGPTLLRLKDQGGILKLSSNLKNQGFLSTSSTGLRTFRQWPMLRLKVLRSVMGLKALDFNQFLLQRPLARSERGPGPCLCIAVQVYQDFTIIKVLAFGNNGITMATESCQPWSSFTIMTEYYFRSWKDGNFPGSL